MFSLKKTSLAILYLTSSAAFSGTMGPMCEAGDVTVPCETNTWALGITALYLQPSYNGAPVYFNYLGSTPSTFASDFEVRHDLKKDWQWGFKLEAAYLFGNGSDFNVNWYHWKDTVRDNTISGYNDPGYDSSTTIATPKITAQWDAINFELGQHVDFGRFSNIRFHGGFQYVHLQHEELVPATQTYISFVNNRGRPLPPGTPPRVSISNSVDHARFKFDGIGPRAGSDASLEWANGLGVYAKGAAGLLVGQSKVYDRRTGDENDSSTQGRYTAIVPELEVKVGATYAYVMARGQLTVDAGYMVVNYFNPFHYTSGGVTDFGLQGPYAGLKWVANA